MLFPQFIWKCNGEKIIKIGAHLQELWCIILRARFFWDTVYIGDTDIIDIIARFRVRQLRVAVLVESKFRFIWSHFQVYNCWLKTCRVGAGFKPYQALFSMWAIGGGTGEGSRINFLTIMYKTCHERSVKTLSATQFWGYYLLWDAAFWTEPPGRRMSCCTECTF